MLVLNCLPLLLMYFINIIKLNLTLISFSFNLDLIRLLKLFFKNRTFLPFMIFKISGKYFYTLDGRMGWMTQCFFIN